MNARLLALVGALLIPASPVLQAHHPFAAEYDSNKPVKVTGVVTKVEWTNPHIWFYVDVKDEQGKVTNWGFSAGPPGVLQRRGISRDLGFTADERSENLRRSAEVARLFNDAGVIVLAAFVAPDEAIRQKAAATIGRERFFVIHLDASLEVCRERDTDGHYKLADSGEIATFPGVSSPYELPANPDLVLETDKLPIDQCVERIVALLESRGALS